MICEHKRKANQPFYSCINRGNKAELELELPMKEVVQVIMFFLAQLKPCRFAYLFFNFLFRLT